MNSILVIGYGNPGRRDDGLGPALAGIVERQGLAGVTVESNYELTVEDAATIAEHDAVVFVDAMVQGEEPFSFIRVARVPALGFSSHSLEPSSVLALAHDLFDSRAPGYLMGIRGYEFEGFGESLSAGAELNLARAAQFLLPVLRERAFNRVERASTTVAQSAGSVCEGFE